MRRSQRLIASAVLISLCGALAGCGGGGLSNWDPSDMLDFLDTKKKLPGKRELVFPEGVPGIEQGVPKDLYKSNVEQQQQQDQAAVAAAAAPPDESAHARRSGATAGTAAGAEAGAAKAAAAPKPRKPKRLVHRRATSLPKDESPAQDQTPQQQPVQQSQPAASPFPAPMPSGSFSR
ncbi:MAG: hypothetical protein NTAFB05_09100 [Nitrobacter sp.]|uniref:hypothetical protein n=1 Tax=Nitrobacter sp. TaxID=29420 RepID=UPI00387DDA24